ncbi:Protein kinase [Globisporangium polare]
MFLFCVALLKYTAFVHHQLTTAGDQSFKPKAILPTFRALLGLLAGATLVLICLNLALIFAFSNDDTLKTDIYIGILYAGRHFVLVLAPAFMYQKSLSSAALMRASLMTMGITFGALVLFLIPQIPTAIELYLSFGILLVFFIAMVWHPAPRASVTVMRRYALFALVHVVLAIAHVVCVHYGVLQTGSPFSSTSSVWTSATPFFVWQLLKSDTEYWRGKGAQSTELQQLFAKRIKVTERVSAEGLHVLIEMHRKHVIDFSSLELRQQIGDGSNSSVFSGLMKCKVPVSVKVYTPADLSDEVIAEYSQEAALCGNLEHPNIVRFYGLSVCPPTISLVFELCRGSLKEISALANDDDYGCKSLIKITQMLDAARAVAYLHSFSPPFIHRELSLASFLIDVYGVVKLSGFGDSRILNQFTESSHHLPRPPVRSVSGAPWEERTATATSSPYEAFDYSTNEVARKVSFHPPYSERVDVYALGMAFWQLLHPKVELPKPGNEAYNDSDWRPLFHEFVPADVQKLIESTWEHDTRARPTALQVVRKLEAIQQKALADNLDCVATAVDTSRMGSLTDAQTCNNELADGADAVRNLVSSNQVQQSWEAVRLGNAWMEAGFLHEEKHAAPFQNKPGMRYFFTPQEAAPAASDSIVSVENENESSMIVIGMSMSTRESNNRTGGGGIGGGFGGGLGGALRVPRRCMCKSNARQVAMPRRMWRAFATAESRAAAQHDFTMSSSYESLLTSVLLVDNDHHKQ